MILKKKRVLNIKNVFKIKINDFKNKNYFKYQKSFLKLKKKLF